jgi:hypothetical protein
MKKVIEIEELGMFLLTIYLFGRLPLAWWWYPALIFVPDLSMIGYGFGNKAGAVSYNFIHHKAVAIAVYIAGVHFENVWLQLAGLIMFGHSSMDRMTGYGLKTFAGFTSTHLGEIGK